MKEFDFKYIESELTALLLASSSPLALQCAQFAYAGEIRKSGGLRRLGAKIPQLSLTGTLTDQVISFMLLSNYFNNFLIKFMYLIILLDID